MSKKGYKSWEQFPEVFLSEPSLYQKIRQGLRQGTVRKLASRLYTCNVIDAPETIVRRHVWALVAAYFPNALIADRTALENQPASDGSIFIISNKKRDIALPGIHIYPRKGIKALPSDIPFIHGLTICSQARAFIENIRFSRSRSHEITRTLSQEELEEKLELLIRRYGIRELNRLRDQIKSLATSLELTQEAILLDMLIGSLIGTRSTKLKSEGANMRSLGTPYEKERLLLFEMLAEKLENTAPIIRHSIIHSEAEHVHLAFFEAYFSNFIEGTEFAVSEAKEIIFAGRIPEGRPEDAHDVLGTYHIVSDKHEMQKTPSSFDELVHLLKTRHSAVMGSRKDKSPGHFKTEENRAGGTLFVAPELVMGTLQKGFEIYRTLSTEFARATFMMFLVSEVHPFTDGNGRLSRIMMNAELISKQQQRIIIPTIYRNNYLQALKALSLSHHPEPLIRTLDFAQKFTRCINWHSIEQAQSMLQHSHAFMDPHEADERGIRLTISNGSW